MNSQKFKSTEELAKWNDSMVKKYHSEGTLFESKNLVLRLAEYQRLKKMVKMAEIKFSDSVLDLGCGEGHLLSLLPKAKKIEGIDISKQALKTASRVLKNKQHISLFFGNAQDLKNVKNNLYTKVFCSEMLEHVPEPETVMKEIHRILKPGKILVASIPDEKRIMIIMRIIKMLFLDKILYSARKNETYEWHLHDADLKFMKKISKSYFKILKVKRVPLILGYRFVIKLISLKEQ